MGAGVQPPTQYPRPVRPVVLRRAARHSVYEANVRSAQSLLRQRVREAELTDAHLDP